MTLCSIILATYNRVTLLSETLESLCQSLAQSKLREQVEVVVVDNNSQDDTSRRANAFQGRLNKLLILHEERQGLSHARNTGISASTGKLIVFLDDDVEVDPGWLEALVDEMSDPNVWIAGGRVKPHGISTLPDWLPHEYSYLVSIFDPSPVAIDMPKVMGGNSITRRDVFDKIGVFDPRLGRRGKKLLGGEEVEFYQRVWSKGGRIRYTPHAVIHHKIQDKLQKSYVIEYAYWLGVSEANIDRLLFGQLKFLAKYFRSLIFPWFVYPIQGKYCRAPDAAVRFLIKKQFSRGYLDFRRVESS